MPATRDWSSMREMATRLLEERTGETLATWNARVKRQKPADEDALRAWLGVQGVTGYAQTLLVWERFGYPDFMTADAEALIDAQYAERAHLRPVFEAILDAAAALGDVAIQARKTYVSLVTPRRTFARVRAKAHHVELGLRLDLAPRGRLKRSTIHESMPVQLELAKADELDDEARRWLQRAYDESG